MSPAPRFRARTFSLALILAALPRGAGARSLPVGPGKAYASPCAAAAAAKDGDTVQIDPGTYSGDVCGWTASNLLIRATAAYAHLDAAGKNAMGKGTWVIQGGNTTVENIEFSGASVPDQNGAGIRQEGENLTVRHCWFHDNENGILSGSGNGDVLIEYSVFENNGFGDGYTHNMYIGNTRSFTLRYCFTHGAKIGHDVKTRALANRIMYNRISDEADGTASYEIDMPDGGSALILGNIIQQGPKSDNPTILTYGEESLKNPAGPVYIVNNTFVNDKGNGTFIHIAAGANAQVWNNLFSGAGTLISGAADSGGNVIANAPAFADRAGYDYHLTAASPAIDRGSEAPYAISSVNLMPFAQYRHPADQEPRRISGAPDAGAYEYSPGDPIRPPRSAERRGPRADGIRYGCPVWIASGDGTGDARPYNSLGRSLAEKNPR